MNVIVLMTVRPLFRLYWSCLLCERRRHRGAVLLILLRQHHVQPAVVQVGQHSLKGVVSTQLAEHQRLSNAGVPEQHGLVPGADTEDVHEALAAQIHGHVDPVLRVTLERDGHERSVQRSSQDERQMPTVALGVASDRVTGGTARLVQRWAPLTHYKDTPVPVGLPRGITYCDRVVTWITVSIELREST